MNFKTKLDTVIKATNSAVCVGLDFDLKLIPDCLKNDSDAIFKFNKEIIDATREFTAAYKPNLAFYETFGVKGLEAFLKTVEYIGSDRFIIADAKRGDIGNTSKKYAEAFLTNFNCDAITVSPYMGEDSIMPFLEDENKGVFILALTSNKGSNDFQMLKTEKGTYLYEEVIKTVIKWNVKGNCGLVVGATHPSMLGDVRKLAGDLPFLIPGIGAQGGDLEATVKYAFVKDKGLALINSSRGIIYASKEADFAERAGIEAKKLRDQINGI